MLQRGRIITVGATLAIAFVTGHIMQRGGAIAGLIETAEPIPAVPTPSLESGLPLPPVALFEDRTLPGVPVRLASADQAQAEAAMIAEAPVVTPFVSPCAAQVSAVAETAGMVSLVASAPCLAETRVLVEHAGLSFTALTDEYGDLSLVIPALAQDAEFALTFSDGTQAGATAQVPELASLSRTVLQWRGESGFALHAFENDAALEAPGHVFPGNPRSAAGQSGGFLTLLGEAAGVAPRYAQVYTHPRTPEGGASVSFAAEAEILATTCGRDIAASVISIGPDGARRDHALSFSVPGCSALGDYLVLNNLLEGPTLAQN